MKLKPMLKYELRRSLGLLLGFYVMIFVAPNLFSPILLIISGVFSFESLFSWIVNLIPNILQSFVTLRNLLMIDLEVFVFLIFLGIISFAPDFRISQSLNIPRKALFKSQFLHIGIIATAVSLANSLLSFLASFSTYLVSPIHSIFFRTNWFYFMPTRYSIGDWNENATTALRSAPYIICYFLWTLSISAMALALGYLIGICFYRMTWSVRRQFTVAAPVFVLPSLAFLLAYLSPLMEQQLFGDIFITAFILTPAAVFQITALSSPYFAILFHIILFAVFALLCWLLLRHLTVSLPDPPNRKWGFVYSAAHKQAK